MLRPRELCLASTSPDEDWECFHLGGPTLGRAASSRARPTRLEARKKKYSRAAGPSNQREIALSVCIFARKKYQSFLPEAAT
jgi:hypothetical protein